MLSRRDFLASAGTLGAACSRSSPARPNILFLMPDQWRGMDLGAMGNRDVLTPNMDSLASGGALLANVTANCPVCCPARGTLLTGRFGHQHRVDVNDAPLPDAELTIAEIAQDHGYRTSFAGKWHLEGGKRLPGFVAPARRQGFQHWAANICSHAYWNMHYFRDSPDPIPIDGYSATAFTDETISFIRRGPNTPFLAYLQWGPPHNPYVAPPEYMALYKPERLRMRENWRGPVEFRPNRTIGSRADIAGYYAAITFLDHEVGRIVSALRETRQLRNTIIVITSDHGDMLGSQGSYLKRKPWGESLQVPGIVHWPDGVAPGQVLSVPFSHVDFVPTMLGLAGIDIPSGLAGVDLSHHISNSARSRPSGLPEAVYAQSYTPTERGEHPPWRAVRSRRYTYARHQLGPWLLYDNDSDPYQLRNLADDPQHAALMTRLDDLTMDWFRRTGDDWRERRDQPYR